MSDKYSTDDRKRMAKAGSALPDGSFEEVHLHEAAALEPTLIDTSDGSHIMEVTLIRPGVSKMGNNYPVSTLRESVSLFEGARAFADHNRNDALPERSIRDLVGSYRNVRLDESGRIRGHLHLIPGNDWLFAILKEAEGNPNLAGLSIDADGIVTRDRGPDGKPVQTVSQIVRVASCDIVTRPSAGGAVNRILASDTTNQLTDSTNQATAIPQETTVTKESSNDQQDQEQAAPRQQPAAAALTENQVPTTATTASPAPSAIPTPTVETPNLAQLIEAQRAELARARSELAQVHQVLNPGVSSTVDPNAELVKLAEELRHDRDLARAEQLLSRTLADAALPRPVDDKLRRQFGGRSFAESDLLAVIGEEKQTLAALTSAGMIRDQGFEKPIAVGMSEYDQVQAAFDALFDIKESDAAAAVPRFSGIREAFRVACGVDIGTTGGCDRPILEAFSRGLRNKIRSGALQESEGFLANLQETDVTTATFSYLLGTSMNKRLLADYMAWPSEWQKFTNIVGIKDFKQQDRVRLGAFGSLSTVTEDNAYTTLTLSDARAIYSAAKRGNLVQISRETIVNDDLYAIKQIPQKLAVAAAFTLAEFVYNLLAPSFGNIYDSHNLFDSINHANTGVIAANLGTANSGAALSSSALQTAVIKMRKQTNLASKPIGLKPRFLLVPPDLEFTAMTILKSAGLPGGNNNDINPMMGYAEPIVSPQLNALSAGPSSTTIWIAIADPRVIDTLEVGFVGGQANPVLLIQDMPLYGLNFTQDVISYKVRHEYGGAVTDYRGFYLGNN